MADISTIDVGGAEYSVKDAIARGGWAAQLVLPSSTQPLGQATYSANADVLLSRYKTYYKQDGETYTALTLGTDYEAKEYSGVGDVYIRAGGNTHTYQSDMTATFLADRLYSRYDKINKQYVYLTEVTENPGFYEYVPGVTTFGDKPYEVFLEDPYVYTLSSDTVVDGAKTYCRRFGAGTVEDPYEYKVVQLTAGRPFNLFVQNGYAIQDIVSIVNPLITPHKQTT